MAGGRRQRPGAVATGFLVTDSEDSLTATAFLVSNDRFGSRRRRLKRLLRRVLLSLIKPGRSSEHEEDDIVAAQNSSATNDIGIITLPDGKHLAIAGFVSDSSADPGTARGRDRKDRKGRVGPMGRCNSAVMS